MAKKLKYRELSLKPYSGKCFIAYSRKEYEQAHLDLFKIPDVLTCAQGGRFSGGKGMDNKWTYLLYAANTAYLAHEIAHVILQVFKDAGIDPREANGEPFCYMLSQMLIDAKK